MIHRYADRIRPTEQRSITTPMSCDDVSGSPWRRREPLERLARVPVDGGGGGGELRAASAPSNRQLHVLPCDNAQQHVHLVELGSAITAALAVDEDVALLHRAARHHRHVARLLAGRVDRAERLDHQVLAKRPRAGQRVRGSARVGRSGSGPREWTSADPSELTATESDAALLRY